METLRELYKIGHGPSSSHTMGPKKACEMIKKKYPTTSHVHVVLYGSLALTGKGHLTDRVVEDTFYPWPVRITFDQITEVLHPNTMDVFLYEADEMIGNERVFSIGGGTIQFRGEEVKDHAHIYPHRLFEDIKAYCKEKNMRLSDYVKEVEGPEVIAFLGEIWEAMEHAIQRGLATEGVLPGELEIKRKAPSLLNSSMKREPPELTENRLVSAYAYAVSEENASAGQIVTAPTCGASGVLPAVLYYMKEKHTFSKKRVIDALAVAGLIGNLIKHNASISGAEAGCQAEVGSACAMAAAAHAELFKLSLDQVEYAAEIAIEHHLGLTCDPVMGYVQIPCIERNAVAALRAIDACGLAYFLSDWRKISLDIVIATMYETGRDLRVDYRETSTGGLAKMYKKS